MSGSVHTESHTAKGVPHVEPPSRLGRMGSGPTHDADPRAGATIGAMTTHLIQLFAALTGNLLEDARTV
jgi:hypothetical protein